MNNPPPHQTAGPTARNLLARHVMMVFGLIAVIVGKWLYYGAAGRPVILMVVIDLPAAFICLYAPPFAALVVSTILRRRITGLTFFRITLVMWLILVPSLWRLNLS